MYAKNLLITFLGFLIALTAYFNSQSGIREPFLGMHVRGTARSQQVKFDGKGKYSADLTSSACNNASSRSSPPSSRENYHQSQFKQYRQQQQHRQHRQHRQRKQGPPTFAVPGKYQSNLSPRFQPHTYSANINYNAPSQQYLGVPKDPLGYAADVQKHNIRETYNNNLSASLKLDQASPDLPAGTMDGGVGQKSNFIVDRFYTGIAKSPTLKGSDYIRGDLAVVPEANPCKTQAWGKPWQAYASAPTNLNMGALSQLAGSNSAATSLDSFVQEYSGGTALFAGGVANAPLENTTIGAAMNLQSHMKSGSRVAQNFVGATAF